MSQVALNDIEKVLRKELGPFGLDHVELKAGRDHDGDAAVFVTAVLPPKSPPIPGDVSGAASVAIAQLMESTGDERLSYLYIKRPDDERPLEESRGISSST
jgi:hypothetical protein